MISTGLLHLFITFAATWCGDEPPARSIGAHDPSAERPLGERHAAAPAELEQFEFLLGSFDVVYASFDAEGEEVDTDGAFGAVYCLNGYGRRDFGWDASRGVATASFYSYDAANSRWRCVALRMPDYESRESLGTAGDDGLTLTSPEHVTSRPHGQRNPSAASELEQFDFMVGEFDTREEIRSRDGTWRKSVATWNAAYFLGGFGVRDSYWNEQEGFATTNLRVFDPASGKWFVTFLSAPGNSYSVWQGGRIDDRMIMRPLGQSGSRLTFFNIHADGYDWVSETVRGDVVTAGWREFATRAK